MKLHIKKVIIIVLTLAIVLMIYYFIQFQPPLKPMIRHINPYMEIERNPMPILLTSSVSKIFDNLIIGNYNATIKELNTLSIVYIPERYRFIANRFMQLLNDTSITLNDIEVLLNKAENLIKIGKEEDAKNLLYEASLKITSVNITYNELKNAYKEFAKSFNIQAIDYKIDKISEIINNLHERLIELLKIIEKQKTLENSYLVIDAKPRTVWVGENIEVFGRLYTEKENLTEKTIQIYVDEVMLAKAITDNNGEFHINITIPYVYKPSIKIQAIYISSDNYKSALSNIIEVNLLYIKPVIKAEVIGDVLPGKSFILKGSIKAEKSLPYSFIKISYFDHELITNSENGNFMITLYTPDYISEGEYNIKIETSSWKIFAPAETNIKINVKKLPINATIQLPKITLAGLSLNINGKIYNEETNTTIKTIFLDHTYTTNSNKEFNMSLFIPLNTFSGYYNYEVDILPNIPWYKSIILKGSILVINPIIILAPISLISLLSIRISKEKRKEIIEKKEIQKEVQAFEKISIKKYSKYDWIIDMYWQALDKISKLVGIDMKPSMTLREYFNEVKSKIGNLKDHFEILTIITEKALYSYEVSNNEIELLKNAFEKIKYA